MMKKSIFYMVVVCAFTAPVVASAEDKHVGTVKEQISITYNPTVASTVEGRERLERRIRQAAAEVCGPQTIRRAGSLSLMSANRNCYRKAVADAMSAIKHSGVAAKD